MICWLDFGKADHLGFLYRAEQVQGDELAVPTPPVAPLSLHLATEGSLGTEAHEIALFFVVPNGNPSDVAKRLGF